MRNPKQNIRESTDRRSMAGPRSAANGARTFTTACAVRFPHSADRRNGDDEMSRFILSAAAHEGAFHFRAGDRIADSVGSAGAGDKIAPKLCAKPFAGMIPLDASAVAALAAVGIATGIGSLIVPVTGVSS